MAVLVNMSNVDLHRGMVLGGDETVCRRTNSQSVLYSSRQDKEAGTICGGRRGRQLFLDRFP